MPRGPLCQTCNGAAGGGMLPSSSGYPPFEASPRGETQVQTPLSRGQRKDFWINSLVLKADGAFLLSQHRQDLWSTAGPILREGVGGPGPIRWGACCELKL